MIAMGLKAIWEISVNFLFFVFCKRFDENHGCKAPHRFSAISCVYSLLSVLNNDVVPAATPPAEAAPEARHARLIQIGTKVVGHVRYVAAQLAGVAAFQHAIFRIISV